MRLRPRPRRSSSLRRSDLVIVIILICILFLAFQFFRSENHGNNDDQSILDFPTRDFASVLAKFAMTKDEFDFINRTPNEMLESMLRTFAKDKQEQLKISLASKAKAGQSRTTLLADLEPNIDRRTLLGLLARKRNRDLGIRDDFSEVEIVNNNVPTYKDSTFKSTSFVERTNDNDNEAINDDNIIERLLKDLPVHQQRWIVSQMSMDTEKKWRDIPSWALAKLEEGGSNPLNRNCSRLNIPDHAGKYGGLTADCGWVIMSMVYSLETGACGEFSDKWGHGCDEEGRESGWTCFFKPIQQRENEPYVRPKLPRQSLISGKRDDRHMVRRDHMFKRDFVGHRYERLNNLINENEEETGHRFNLDWNADLLAWRLVFRWTFRPNDNVRRQLDDIQQKVLQGFRPEEIAGAHLRFGDKLGLRPGPREAFMVYQIKDFAQRLALYYSSRNLQFPKAIFVATDDYNASVQLGELLGKSVTVLTSADPSKDRGFSIVEYRQQWTSKDKFDAAVRLWADMEILSRTEMVLLSFQSNIGRTVTLMRFGKPANTVISVDPIGPRCSRSERVEQLRTHNFWLCP